jgi:predicted NUDIX family NTP pyrophosphohydrolase
MSKVSAGILLFKIRQGRLSVLLVHPGGPFWRNKDAGAWSIPKGEHTGEEDARDAAFREFEEETGVRLPDTRAIDLGLIRQKGGKQVRAWAVEGEFDTTALRSNLFDMEWPPRSGRTERFPEVDRAQWCDPDTARTKIIPAQAELVERLISILRDQGRVL